MQKRGAIEVQFNWIFIIIAGAIFLVFFFAVVKSMQGSSDTKLNTEIAAHLDTVLKNAAQASSTGSEAFRMIAFPAVTLQFTCEEDFSSMRIGGQGIEMPLDTQIIFSEQQLQGDTLYAWTQNFEIPYRIQSFLYLTSSDALYVFIEDDGLIEEMYRGMPANISTMLVEEDELMNHLETYKSYDYVTFIGYTVDYGIFQPSGLLHAKALNLEQHDVRGYHGDIAFYKYTGDSFLPEGGSVVSEGRAAFLTKQLFYGAIFSGSREMYMCNANKALARAERITEIMLDRTDELEDWASEEEPVCSSVYLTGKNALEIISQNLNLSLDQFYTIQTATTRLHQDNQDLIRGGVCPLLY